MLYCTSFHVLAILGVPASALSADYIIVGAGTSGLVVANRLSENPDVTVVAIEPGTDQRANPNVTDPDNFQVPFGTEIDWSYDVVSQPGAGDQTFILHQGKAWGGTSTINGMTYIRGESAQIDAWEELGNPGWNWDSLLPYYIKSENYTIPHESQLAAGATYDVDWHGFDGPLHTGYSPNLVNTSSAALITETWQGLSLPHNPDLNSGHPHGFSIGPMTVDAGQNLRWDAARAYYYPVEHRPNLSIVRGMAKRIVWKTRSTEKGDRQRSIEARGVEYIADNGKLHVLMAKKEVILAAGSVRTPLILEGSGIGNPSLLKSLGIETKVVLPGVGENFLEQTNHLLAFAATTEVEPTWGGYHGFVTMEDLFGDATPGLAASTREKIPQWVKEVVADSTKTGLRLEAVEKLLRIQHELLFKQKVAAAEIIVGVIPGDGVSYAGATYWLLMPFSRGSVHLRSVHEINNPIIDPRFFRVDFDLSATVATGRLGQKFWLSDPVSNLILAPVLPGEDLLPNNATDEQWEAFTRESPVPNSHGLGSASMMARELGGVVDPELRVYGTANVRVVDASIIPMQISGHLTASIYAVAERASDIIKGTWN